MPRPKREAQAPEVLPTIWRVSDEMWAKIKALLDENDPPKRMGRKRVDARAVCDAVIYRLRSGVQWNHLPKEFPDDSSVHRTFQRWVRLGLFDLIWGVLVVDCDELGEVHWEWQAADCWMGKARLGGIKLVPIRLTEPRMGPRRASSWSKRAVL
jgi:putative transposase